VPDELIGRFGYAGIILLLVLGGLGLPVPEEAPIIIAAMLAKKGVLWGPAALAACVVGVLVGDFVVYFLGYYFGEKVLGFRLTRKFLTRAREAQIKGYFSRHGVKILILGRFAVGFRTAAYLTAGILRLPPLKLLVTDLFAVALSTPLMFALGWIFARQIEVGLREAQHYATAGVVAALLVWLLVRYYRARRRAGQPIGPPVLEGDDADARPPHDDLHPPPPPPPPAPALEPAAEVPAPIPLDAGPEPESVDPVAALETSDAPGGSS